MERIPEEVALHIISFLNVSDLLCLQAVSSRFLSLGRDNSIWKAHCFDNSRAEALRRNQQLRDAQDSGLAELRNAVTALPGNDLTAWDVSQIRGSQQPRASRDPMSEARKQRIRALANWEPGYPDESFSYYDEYIHRHAPIEIDWFNLRSKQAMDRNAFREATGLGVLSDLGSGNAKHLVTPLDNGSICIWDLSYTSTMKAGGRRRLIAQSKPGLLTGQDPDEDLHHHGIMTDTGAVECVAIDDRAHKGYFAVQNLLHEVDLNTLQLMSSKQYPWHVTALSKADGRNPITVGTNNTVHLHDPRDRLNANSEPSSGVELIGGSVYSHATLEQPGPLSILHGDERTPGLDSIWVAGRFTSLLNYDRRFFPRLLGTMHSGARISSLAVLPYPHIPRNLDLMRNPNASMAELQAARSAPGTTLLAAAEYKGKGSLELFGFPNNSVFQNRQTASASKLLSVASHGGRIVVGDGDGNIKWLERDGFSHVRTFNINEPVPKERSQIEGLDDRINGLWGTAEEHGDIVQKIIPASSADSTTAAISEHDRYDTNQSRLFLWSGDGRIGVLGYGFNQDEDEDVNGELGTKKQTTEERAREDAQRQYSRALRRALERNADEVRFVRGLGMV